MVVDKFTPGNGDMQLIYHGGITNYLPNNLTIIV